MAPTSRIRVHEIDTGQLAASAALAESPGRVPQTPAIRSTSGSLIAHDEALAR